MFCYEEKICVHMNFEELEIEKYQYFRLLFFNKA